MTASNPLIGQATKAPPSTRGWTDARLSAIRQAVAILADPEHAMELRAVTAAGARSVVLSGADHDGLASEAARLNDLPDCRAVYFCLNPVALRPGEAGSADDEDVIRRRWLLVDIDPVRRGAGPDSNSTEAEHEAARELALAARDWLCKEMGWPEPILIDSGNGWHLLFRIDLPNDEEARALLAAVLAAMKQRLDTEQAHVDGGVFNASRLSKLPGTRARKARGTPQRPQRWARIVEQPESPQVVDMPKLQAVSVLRDNLLNPDNLVNLPNGKHTLDVSPLAGHFTRLSGFRRASLEAKPNGRYRNPLVGIATGEEVSARAYARRALEGELARVALAPGGNRNIALNRAAFSLGQLVPGGHLGEAEVIDALERAAKGAGLEGSEVPRTIRSGLEAGKLEPRDPPQPKLKPVPAGGQEGDWSPVIPLNELPAPEPFPLDVLPAELRALVREGAWAYASPPDFVAVPILAVASGAIGNRCRLEVTPSHRQPAILFTCIVGLPGTLKSPALALAVSPLEREERRLLDIWKAAKKQYKECPEECADPGPASRLLVDEITQEALVARLSENGQGLLMFRDELAALIKGMDQYRSGGKGNERQLYLKLWSQGTVRNDRKSNEDGAPVTVYRPFLAVVGGTQPSVVACIRGEGRRGEPAPDDGLMDRFLFSYPALMPACEESWRVVSDAPRRAWLACVRRLLGMKMVPMCLVETGKDEDGQPIFEPRRVTDRVAAGHAVDDAKTWLDPDTATLTTCGRKAWRDFTRRHAAEVNDEDFPDFLRGPWSKLRGYCARLALVIHLLRWASGELGPIGDGGTGMARRLGVDGESVARAERLTDYFKAHCKRALAVMEVDRTVALCRRILRWVAKNGKDELKRYEVFRDIKSLAHFPTIESMDRPLERLVRHGFLRLRHQPAKPGTRGRPEADIYDVNPEAWGAIALAVQTRRSPPDMPGQDGAEAATLPEEEEL